MNGARNMVFDESGTNSTWRINLHGGSVVVTTVYYC